MLIHPGNNCKKGNRPCPGYDQDLKFQDEGARLRKRFEKKNDSGPREGESTISFASESNSSKSASTAPSPEPSSDVVVLPDGWDQDFERLPYRNVFFSFLETVRNFDPNFEPGTVQEAEDYDQDASELMEETSETPFNFDPGFGASGMDMVVCSPGLQQEQLLYTFTASMGGSGGYTLPPIMRFHGQWLSRLPAMNGNNLLDTAIRAVGLAHLGRLHTSDSFVNESRPYYGKALRLLNSAILDQEKGTSSETLSATILLSWYEMFASESNEPWVRHAGGAGALMRIRGAARHRYGMDRDIFLAYRTTLVIEAFQQDTDTFLNEPEWRQVAKDIANDVKESGVPGDRIELFQLADDFYFEMLSVPALFRDAKYLARKEVPEGFNSLQELQESVRVRADESRTSLRNLHVKFGVCLVKNGMAPTSYRSGDPVISINYSYANIFIGSSLVGYWTILMILNMLLCDLEKGIHPEKIGLYRMENYEIALECCRSTTAMLKSSFLGPFFIIFALRMALGIFEPGAERDWVLAKLFEIGNTHMRMAAHIPGFEPGTKLKRIQAAPAQVVRERMVP